MWRRGWPWLALALLFATAACGTQVSIAGCRVQANSTFCTVCAAGNFRSVRNKAATCTQCSSQLPNCVECSSSSTCTLCRARFRRTPAGQCERCRGQGCLLCRSDRSKCDVCAGGWVLGAQQQCIPCVGCAGGACTPDGSCPGNCKWGFGKVDGRCVKCAGKDCANCDGDPGVCQACAALGLGVVDGRCQYCLVEGCDVCNSDLTTCRRCSYGYYRRGGRCVQCAEGCLEGYCNPDGTCRQCKPTSGLVNGTCQQCFDYTNCKNCDGNRYVCVECLRHRGLYNEDGTCRDCFDSDIYDTCEWCDLDPSTCSKCGEYDYMSRNQRCISCSTVTPYCLQCSNARMCTKCWDGYLLQNGRCLPCSAGCTDCNRGLATCDACDIYYVLDTAVQRCVPL
ncbi:hypothetical protein ABPG75_007199 [Micractinium tetrahymenae]